MAKNVYGILVWLIVAQGFAYARDAPQTREPYFQRYTSLDGLPHNAISDLHIDRRGFLWICTWYGLSRFDGYTFKNYRTLPGDQSPLSHNRFLKISEDAAGYLWLTPYDNRLYRFDRAQETFTDIPHALDAYADKNYKIDRYLNASNGDTWIALSGAGLIRSHRPTEETPLAVTDYFDDPAVGREITLLAEDRSGDVWVVSEAGLARIPADGTAETVLKNDRITEIVDIGTHICFASGGRVILLDRSSGALHEVAAAPDDRVTALAASPDGATLYIGTARSGIAQYVVAAGRLTPDPHRPGRVRYLVCDSRGTLWVTTADPGITRYDPVRGDYRRFEQQMNTASYYVDSVTKVLEHGDRVWIKMNRVGFGYYDRRADRVEPFYNDPTRPGSRLANGVACFTVDESDVLWMSTISRGLEKITLIDQKAEIFAPDSRIANRASSEIRALLTDADNRLWMANKSGELFCYDSTRRLVHKYPDARTGTIGLVYAMKQDSRGHIWLATKGNGIFRMSPAVGGGYGFTHFGHDPRDRKSLAHNDIYTIEEDRLGRIWIGSYGGGVMRFDDGRFVTALNSFPAYPREHGMKVRWLLSLPDGRMMAATVEGVIVFDPAEPPDEMRFELFRKVPGDIRSLGNNDVIHMFTDSRDRVWLSTFGGGLNLLTGFDARGEPRFDVFSTDHGLASNIVFAATEDREGCIWLSTENGISRFDPETERFSNYTTHDGIPPAVFSEAAALTDRSGTVCFGSLNNLYIIDPATMRQRPVDYRLAFTSLEVRNREVQAGEGSPLRKAVTEAREVVFPYDYSVFRIGYGSLNFKLQPRLNYMYKLEGYDQDWNIARHVRSASYSNVPPGRYRFLLRCFLDDDRSAGGEIALDVAIRPPWWKTHWAYFGYSILILLALFTALRIFFTVFSLRNKVVMEHRMTELKLRFFTNISHELRTPLTLILGGVEDVRKGETLSEKGGKSISLAHKNARRMLMIINQLLDFRKIVNDKMEIRVRRTDIVPLASSAADDFREMAAGRGITLTFESPEQLWVWVDPKQIESVIYNLLSNAFKFTPDGGRVILSVAQQPQEGSFTLAVRDTGAGIPKEKQSEIFERFSQAGSPVTDGAGGTGIGLAFCREIVELHRGTIGVESEPGEGSVFTVRLPMGNAHFAMEQIDFTDDDRAEARLPDIEEFPFPSVAADPGTPTERSDAQPPADAPRILLVEDNHELRTFIYNHLASSYRVSEAVDGADALEKIAHGHPDIIVTDLMMPRMDGIELTGRVRDDFSTSHIPIVMLTARTEDQSRIDAMKYGADAYITKPFSVELLLARIDNLLVSRRRLFLKFSSEGTRSATKFDLAPTEIVVTDRDEQFIRKVMSWIDQNIENSELTIDRLASHMGMGRTVMYEKLKSLTGRSPVELVREYRLNKAAMYLRTGQHTVSEVAYTVGFTDPAYFSRCFKEQFGISPAGYMRRKQDDPETSR